MKGLNEALPRDKRGIAERFKENLKCLGVQI